MMRNASLMAFDHSRIGEDIFALAAKLYPICRSITGDGVRKTLDYLCQHIPLDVHEIPTGAPVFDWTIPREWNIRDAYIKNMAGGGHDGQRKSDAHMPTAETTAADSISCRMISGDRNGSVSN